MLPMLLEKGQKVQVIVEVVGGRGTDGTVLLSWAEAVVLSVSAQNREVRVSYTSWRPDLDIPLVSVPQISHWA